MVKLRDYMYIVAAYLIAISVTALFAPCVAASSVAGFIKKVKVVSSHIDNTEPYGTINSPLYLPPFQSLPPTSLHNIARPFCVYPPFSPQPPSTTIPIPPLPPPPFHPAPPKHIPNPSPPKHVPSPQIFQPPVVLPPPLVPLPPHKQPEYAVWCVAKPTVPDAIIQEAMDYACGFGADCESIQPNGACYQPNTLYAHASYAFNSYWQRTKVAGGTCDFGGTAMLVTVDPSK